MSLETLDMFAGYPAAPGFKGSHDTGREAAASAAPRAATLRAQVLELLAKRPMSPEQLADRLGESILSVRPRLSELKADNKVEDSGLRAKTAMGKSCVVWQRVYE